MLIAVAMERVFLCRCMYIKNVIDTDFTGSLLSKINHSFHS